MPFLPYVYKVAEPHPAVRAVTGLLCCLMAELLPMSVS